ncbi:MAG: hypothetical protein ACR2QK_24935 [Acidimicrobiales bacterium]
MRNRPFVKALDKHFPEAMPEADYLAGTADVLARHGFTADNTLACVAACRDEIAAPLLHDVEASWGQPFSLVSLAGMLTAGRTGLSAAVHHAPIEAGKRRMVFYAMPHIAISKAGTIGEVLRPGVTSPSRACGGTARPPRPVDERHGRRARVRSSRCRTEPPHRPPGANDRSGSRAWPGGSRPTHRLNAHLYEATGENFYLGAVIPGSMAVVGVWQTVRTGLGADLIPGPLMLWLAWDLYRTFGASPTATPTSGATDAV